MATSLRILLAGGSGLMGEPTARALLAAGHAVTVLTRGGRPVPAGAEALVADRTDGAALAAVLGGRSFELTVDFLAYDGAGLARLLDTPRFVPGRFAMISTGQVYLVAAERRPPFVEADSERPAMSEPVRDTRDWHNWVYGVGKRAAEAELAARRARGLDAVALRLPVVQGAHDGSRRLWAYLQRMRDGGPILLPDGGGDPVRFVWAGDVARAIVHLAALDALPSFAYNLAMPDEPTLREFLTAVAQCAGWAPRFVSCSWAELESAGISQAVSPYSGHWCSRPDPALAARELCFATLPSIDWLAEVVAAHLAEAAPEPHAGYAQRARELALAAELERAGR